MQIYIIDEEKSIYFALWFVWLFPSSYQTDTYFFVYLDAEVSSDRYINVFKCL